MDERLDPDDADGLRQQVPRRVVTRAEHLRHVGRRFVATEIGCTRTATAVVPVLGTAPFFWSMAFMDPVREKGLPFRSVTWTSPGGLQIERAVDKKGNLGLPKDRERRTLDLQLRLVPRAQARDP